MFLYTLLWALISLVIFNIFLYYFWYKINLLESRIIWLFEKRLWIVPSLFEISKDYIIKHPNVFRDIMWLLRVETTIYDNETEFYEMIYVQSHIHHELDFIFKIINKHNRLLNDFKFIYLRDITIENSFQISENIKL